MPARVPIISNGCSKKENKKERTDATFVLSFTPSLHERRYFNLLELFIYTLILDIFNYYERTTRGKNDY